jgi:hypothetical protein
VHTQFTGFGDDGNELRKPCSVKINTRPEDTQKWIESFREKIIEIYDLELAMSVANGVKSPFSIASPVSCSEFSTMGVVVVNSVSEEFSAIMFL